MLLRYVQMKIYTRTGDDGTTGLIGGDRVRKSDARLECYGTVDELNASLGIARINEPDWFKNLIQPIQSDLFVIGAHLAAPENDPSAQKYLPVLDENLISRLEMQIDSAESQMPALKNFILPGGTELAARLHFSRTICRRAERLVVNFSWDRPVNPIIITYLNRLSDWLFVHARYANHAAGVEDVIWKPA